MISTSLLLAYLFFWDEPHNPYLVVGGVYAAIFEGVLECLWVQGL